MTSAYYFYLLPNNKRKLLNLIIGGLYKNGPNCRIIIIMAEMTIILRDLATSYEGDACGV